ncbi:MAG TPA: hypothetical protein VIN03_01980 [Roseateles sp.]
MDPNMLLLVLVVVVALIAFGAVRFDLLAARWREVFKGPPPPHDAPPAQRHTPSTGFRPHDAPVHKPAFHRSGHRH